MCVCVCACVHTRECVCVCVCHKEDAVNMCTLYPLSMNTGQVITVRVVPILVDVVLLFESW